MPKPILTCKKCQKPAERIICGLCEPCYKATMRAVAEAKLRDLARRQGRAYQRTWGADQRAADCGY